jgi:hypothetical protein
MDINVLVSRAQGISHRAHMILKRFPNVLEEPHIKRGSVERKFFQSFYFAS